MTTVPPTSSTNGSCSSSASRTEPSPVGALEPVLASAMEKGLRRQVFTSLTKIQRYLSKRDPQGLHRIREWYSGETGETDRPEKNKKTMGLRLNFNQHRIRQGEIDDNLLGYLEIPKGIATRSLLIPRQPDWLFSDDDIGDDQPEEAAASGFRWLPPDSNVSNAADAMRRSLKRETMRKILDQWVFLYFRVQRRNWESIVVEEKKSVPDVNVYAEEYVHKWTMKLRFKILRQVPVKMALLAFLSRLGLETSALIVFCRDGFYGLMDVGNIYGEVTKTPCAMIGFNSTPRYIGLKNGDSIYVNSCSFLQRQMLEGAPRQDASSKQNQGPSDVSVEDAEEGEDSNDDGFVMI